jgi:hypothetical protein
MSGQIAVWDWTLPKGDRENEGVQQTVDQLFKKYTYQLEEGKETGYVHYQGRGSLHKKRRFDELKKIATAAGWGDCHFTPSSKESQKGDCFYTVKLDTRIDGPWTDKDKQEAAYIPWQYQGLDQTLRPWQQAVWETADVRDARTINLIFDELGNNGKSTIASLMDLHKRGLDLPPMNDAEKLIQSVADILIARQERNPKVMFVDMPRAMDKKRLGGMYTAIEQIKKGKVYDTRYAYKEWWFDSPQIWVFTNIEPDLSFLSRDRWKLWTIVDGHLTPYKIDPFDPMG